MLKTIIPPAIEPVSLAELALFIREDETNLNYNEMVFLNGLITTAREYCEGYQRRVYITQTLEMSLDSFPNGFITLPRGNLQSVDSIKVKDASGVESDVEFIYSSSGLLGRIAPVDSWPSTTLYPLDPITIRFTCGSTLDKVPLRVKHAILMLCSYWYDNRNAVVIGSISKEVEFSVKALLNLDRIAVI